ncbi:MAG: winged helix-turn-helix domain-containing protein [Candidatus Micrarchaeota archaeon]|nr:winged helix-turn-helix domain-containing protein [Candidatus Micrarchaeota archaeon]
MVGGLEGLAVDRAVRKALSSESRVLILKQLSIRRHTQSELAKLLSITSPTVLEHLSVLIESGLVEKVDEGRKWKYYQLTGKGRELMGVRQSPVPVRSIVLFAVSLLLITSSLYMLSVGTGYSPPEAQVLGDAGTAAGETPLEAPRVKMLAMPESVQGTSQDTASQDNGDVTEEKGIYYVMLAFGIIAFAIAVYTYINNRRREQPII